MIRLVHLLRRRPELSLTEFQERWRDGNGPLVASHQTRLRILRYTQTHRLDEPINEGITALRGPMEPPYDGVAEMWWESEEALAEALSSGAGGPAAAELRADEGEFIDLPQSPLWLAYEHPQFGVSLETPVARPRSGIVKTHFPIRHRPEMTLAQAQEYWRTVHGPLIRSMAPSLGKLHYQQVHRYETPLEALLRQSRGTEVEAYAGHAEVWTDRSIARQGPEVTESGRRAAEDEGRFIDFRRSSTWIGKEHVFVDRL